MVTPRLVSLRTLINLETFFTYNFLWLVPGLLEWRVVKWPRYRRAVFCILAVFTNVTVLAWITALVVLSLIAVENLARHAH